VKRNTDNSQLATRNQTVPDKAIGVITRITGNPKIRRWVYIFLGALTLAMVALSLVQLWVLFTVDNMTAYGSVPAGANGLPDPNQAGAFIILNDEHNAMYQGNLIELLATSDPGVVDPTQGAHLHSAEIKSLLVQSAELGDTTDYRVYRIGVADSDPMKYTPISGNKLLYITPQSATWAPGDYLIDIPAEGMFGGRTYYQFFVDPDQ
jgi:hypothetical protein